MWVCESCAKTFEEPLEIPDEYSPVWNQRYYSLCPYCKISHIKEVEEQNDNT